jgi:hypothetical protein
MGTPDTGERRRSLVRHRHHRQRPHARWRVWPNGYPVLRLASDRERCRGQRSNQPGRALSVELYADAAVSLSADEALCKNYPPCGRSTVTRRMSSRAGAPPSPRALPSLQAGCSRQRESSSMRRRAGLPMLLREVSFLEVHSGSPRPGLAAAAAKVAASGGQCAAGAGFMRPAAAEGSRRRWQGPSSPGG